MTHSLLGRLRRFWLDVHLWIGAGLFVLLMPLGLSGSYLVWHDSIDQWTHPARYAVTRSAEVVPASTLLDAARIAFGQRATPTQLRMPEDEDGPITVVGRVPGPVPPGGRPKTLTAFLDPATGKVLDVADTNASFSGVTHRLHGNLLVTTPGLGRKIVGWLGWAMAINCLTGLWLWWPRNGRVLKALRWRRSPSVFNNLHHMIGFWVMIPLLILSLTGVYISFPQTARALFGNAPAGAPRGPQPPRKTPPPPLVDTNLSIDQAVETAQAEHPGELASVTLPTQGKSAVWQVALKTDGDGQMTVRVDDKTGEIKQGRDGGMSGMPGGPQADPLSRLMRKVHDGHDTGPIWQTLIVLAGLAPTLLGISGIVMWLHRRRLRKLIRHGHDEAAATN